MPGGWSSLASWLLVSYLGSTSRNQVSHGQGHEVGGDQADSSGRRIYWGLAAPRRQYHHSSEAVWDLRTENAGEASPGQRPLSISNLGLGDSGGLQPT